MPTRFKICLLAAMLQVSSSVDAAELTGRLSLLGTAAWPGEGDVGDANINKNSNRLTADQQSLRLMLDEIEANAEWGVHLITSRQHFSGFVANDRHSSDLFRYRELSGDWLNDISSSSSTRIGYEIDHAVYKQRFDTITVGLGRQPVDWGTGRFWQPFNVFGAFAPTDLDTDYKPGIDAAVFDWYPGALSSLTAVYAFSPQHSHDIEDSAALYYRRLVGNQLEIALLAGRIIGNNVMGASLESDWAGIGWRIEGVHYDRDQADQDDFFWISGIDYQFNNTTLIAIEWYHNGLGTSNQLALADRQAELLFASGLLQHLSKNMLGLAVNRDITPLLHAGYTMLISALDDPDRQRHTSTLHQLNFTYSLSNESDLLFSLLYASGKGLNQQDELQSEFGHLPASAVLRWRVYF
ncbi:MAG: hypothetical protein V7731_19105 [Amphritea sp.]